MTLNSTEAATDAPFFDEFEFQDLGNEIYLDFAAATPVRSACLKTMLPFFSLNYANPSNRLHNAGEKAQNALEQARSDVAAIFNVSADEVVFVSSATEANNLLIRGLWMHPLRKRNKILFCQTEHSCITATCQKIKELYGDNAIIEELCVDEKGQIKSSEISKIDEQTLLVCVMDANNETGVVQDQLKAVSEQCRRFSVHLHVDAVQGFARGDWEPSAHLWNSASVSGAKIYGPKGAAALLLKKSKPKIRIEPQMTGGGQESSMRSGTSNLPAIIGLAEACTWNLKNKAKILNHLKKLESVFLETLKETSLVGFTLVGANATRVPGICSIRFDQINGMKLVEEARGLCISVGSACRTLQATASPVLLAMGMSLEEALATVRVSFGAPTSLSDAKSAAARLAQAAESVRKGSAQFPN